MNRLTEVSYNTFIFKCKSKYVDIDTKLKSCISDKLHVYNLLMNNIDVLNTISSTYDNIINIEAIKRLVDSDFSNYKKDIWTLNTRKLQEYKCFDRHPTILTYILLFAQYCRTEYRLFKYIEPFKIFSEMPFSIYEKVIKQMGDSISKEILKGGYFSFGMALGKLTVVRKARFFKEGTTCSNKSLDWGESDKFRDSIVKRHNPKVYDDYKNNRIGVKEYRELIKPYLYNEKNNPNGEKWHIFRTDDYSCWWYWFKSYRMSNLALYWFTPTEYSLLYSQNKTLEDIKFANVNEVIENNLLANTCKLAIINREFNPHTLIYEQI